MPKISNMLKNIKMENNLQNLNYCIAMYHRCLQSIVNNNLNDNLQNVIRGFIQTLNTNNNYQNANNNVLFILNEAFYYRISNLTNMLMNNNFHNYIHEYNNFHNSLVVFENNINNIN